VSDFATSALAASAFAFAPQVHLAPTPQVQVRAAPVEMAETSSRRAALLGLAAVAVPAAANAATPFWQVNKKGISRPQKSTEGCDALKACAKGAGLKWDAAALGVKAADTRKFMKKA